VPLTKEKLHGFRFGKALQIKGLITLTRQLLTAFAAARREAKEATDTWEGREREDEGNHAPTGVARQVRSHAHICRHTKAHTHILSPPVVRFRKWRRLEARHIPKRLSTHTHTHTHHTPASPSGRDVDISSLQTRNTHTYTNTRTHAQNQGWSGLS